MIVMHNLPLAVHITICQCLSCDVIRYMCRYFYLLLVERINLLYLIMCILLHVHKDHLWLVSQSSYAYLHSALRLAAKKLVKCCPYCERYDIVKIR